MRDRNYWKTERDGSTGWHATVRLRRIKLGFHLYRHRYRSGSSDRWVIQPFAIYDRKKSRVG